MKTENTWLIKNVHVLTMTSKLVLRNKNVYIKDGKISSIKDSHLDKKVSSHVIDGSGKYLMPGMINMHTHLGDHPKDLILYLTNGITTIRNMWGYEGFRFKQWLFGTRVFHHLDVKRKVESGELIGPRIFTAGPILDGEEPFLPNYLPQHALSDYTQIKKVIDDQVEKGYDFIKIYSLLSKQNFDDIMAVADHHGIDVVGHVPDDAGLEHVLTSKIRSIEHLYGFINPYKPELNVAKHDLNRLAHLAANHDIWNCPTLIAHERLANIGMRDAFEHEDQMKYVSNKQRKGMRFLQNASQKVYDKKGLKSNHDYMDQLYDIVMKLKSEGAGLLLGTDKALPYVVSGFSEHHEMQLLSQAGLSNYEIIQIATVNAAKCLRQEHQLGTVEVGKVADLILTEENPLEDLSTIKQHHGVMKEGVWYSRAQCDEMLHKIEA